MLAGTFLLPLVVMRTAKRMAIAPSTRGLDRIIVAKVLSRLNDDLVPDADKSGFELDRYFDGGLHV